MSEQSATTAFAQTPLQVGAQGTVPRLSSEALLKGARELLIEHEGALYRLRLTAKGKLILTK